MKTSQALLTLIALACALALGACAAPDSAPERSAPSPAAAPVEVPANNKAILTDKADDEGEPETEADEVPEPIIDQDPSVRGEEKGGGLDAMPSDAPKPGLLGTGRREAPKPSKEAKSKDDKRALKKNKRSTGGGEVAPAAGSGSTGTPSDPNGLIEPVIHRGQDEGQDNAF